MLYRTNKEGFKLRICLFGEFSGSLDEGNKNTYFYLEKVLKKRYGKNFLSINLDKLDNKVLNRKEIVFLSPKLKQKIEEFAPDVIHYIPYSGITFFCFIRAFFLRKYGNSKIIVTVNQNHLRGRVSKILAKLIFNPDCLIVLSSKTGKKLEELTHKIVMLPPGVDIAKFKPVSDAEKRRLREKYGLPKDDFLILHVGHGKKSRNLDVLKRLQERGFQVLLIVSTSTERDKTYLMELKSSGIIVFERYIEKIEELYALSDCYIFPTSYEVGSIELPLSVLEAMTCNLPVITSPFGGLPDFFRNSDGFYFAESIEDYKRLVKSVRNKTIDNRSKVLDFSWERIAESLEDVYQKVGEMG